MINKKNSTNSYYAVLFVKCYTYSTFTDKIELFYEIIYITFN